MATYEYDEAGVMAAYFLITFLALILTPLTISSLSKRSGKYMLHGEGRKDVDADKQLPTSRMDASAHLASNGGKP